MSFPEWAPSELINLYEQFDLQEAKFKASNYPLDELEQHARLRGFQNWKECHKAITLKQEILFRIISRPEMRSVWKWTEKQEFTIAVTERRGLVGAHFNAIEVWFKTAQATDGDRKDEFKEMAVLANSLSRKLQKYSGENHAFNSYMSLVPQLYENRIKRVINPELTAMYEKKNYSNRFVIDSIMPPLSEILSKLAVTIKDTDGTLPSYFPKKMSAKNAFRTYLINVMVDQIFKLQKIPPPSIVATFMSVALDDAAITIDTVRNSASMKSWRNYRKISG